MHEQLMTKTHHSIKHIAIVVGGLLAIVAGMVTWMQLWTPPVTRTPPMIATQQATLLPQLKMLPPFSLQDQLGKAFDNQRLLGQWTFLNFGYTHCPDICPTTLALLADLNNRLQSVKQTPPLSDRFRFHRSGTGLTAAAGGVCQLLRTVVSRCQRERPGVATVDPTPGHPLREGADPEQRHGLCDGSLRFHHPDRSAGPVLRPLQPAARGRYDGGRLSCNHE